MAFRTSQNVAYLSEALQALEEISGDMVRCRREMAESQARSAAIRADADQLLARYGFGGRQVPMPQQQIVQQQVVQQQTPAPIESTFLMPGLPVPQPQVVQQAPAPIEPTFLMPGLPVPQQQPALLGPVLMPSGLPCFLVPLETLVPGLIDQTLFVPAVLPGPLPGPLPMLPPPIAHIPPELLDPALLLLNLSMPQPQQQQPMIGQLAPGLIDPAALSVPGPAVPVENVMPAPEAEAAEQRRDDVFDEDVEQYSHYCESEVDIDMGSVTTYGGDTHTYDSIESDGENAAFEDEEE